MHKIDSKITGWKIKQPEEEKPAQPAVMGEAIKRPEKLQGVTYKLKSPQYDHAIYITINDLILNQGTEFETIHPYEIFINSKNMESFQWVLAMTRLISAVFRKGGDIQFMVEELKQVFDPGGGYFKKKKYVPSLVADIGGIIETHLIMIGTLQQPDYKVVFDGLQGVLPNEPEAEENQFPDNATLCSKCQHKAVVVMDGCQTCLNCGDSKCG